MLEDELIRLRALEPQDLDRLYLWENNKENWKVSHTLAPYSRHVLSQYIENAGDVHTDKQLRLVIELINGSEPIGTLDLFDCDFKNKRAGIGILIADVQSRGQGLASRCLGLVLPYCFETLDLVQVYCNILADNEKSLALFEKFGFEKVGLKKSWTRHNGIFYDEWLLQKLKN